VRTNAGNQKTIIQGDRRSKKHNVRVTMHANTMAVRCCGLSKKKLKSSMPDDAYQSLWLKITQSGLRLWFRWFMAQSLARTGHKSTSFWPGSARSQPVWNSRHCLTP
jgi:hypothetical protein